MIGEFYIDTIHQAVTLHEEQLWRKFISNYQLTIETGKSLVSENKMQLKTVKKSSLKYVGYAIFGAIVFGIPSGVIAYFTGFEIVVTMGAVSGALIFMINKINKDKQEKYT